MITFIGDIHLGHKRQSFTTKMGRDRYEREVFEHAKSVIEEHNETKVIQVGDLFDKPQNSDRVMAEGIRLASSTDGIISGNHDLLNSDGKPTTLSLISEQLGGLTPVIRPHFTEPRMYRVPYKGNLIASVPYCYTQALFEQSLAMAEEHAKGEDVPGKKVLVLHTNYALEFDMNETTNNLTKARAKELLKTFDYVLSGHEHNSSTHLGGRLIMTGSLMPLSMSEMTNKYVWHLTEAGEIEKTLVWSPEGKYVVIDCNEMPEHLSVGTQFVDVVGQADPGDMPKVMKRIAGWWNTCETLLVCRPSIDLRATKAEQLTETGALSVTAQLRQLLPNAQLRDAFDTLITEVQNECAG